ncbi:transmembrane and coiled-coil domain-containing protein 7 [Clonorchis sinensis]|uniref:Transmembrane and coiled-coil domain-containing protein 7 n=1 Tax=Clonorchis sinensis TaxID=79923 RepID=H2KRT6_CLOSI|nr:transmembrane and coiled-coil domain-containing protein 7 [Clonorchis sinensis]
MMLTCPLFSTLIAMSQAIVDLITYLIPQAHSSTSNPSGELALCVQSYTERADQSGNLSRELSGKDVHEAFCLCCIDYLEKVSRISSELATSGDLLFSVAREQQLRKCLEFLICLGVYPMLDSGVGLPLSMRLDSAAYNCPNQSRCPDRCTKLLKVARCLIFLRESKLVQLNRLMSPGVFLGDFITCLVQIAHGPVGLAPTVDGQLLSEQRKASVEARKQLWKLLCDLPRHVAMKELLILQGGTTGAVKVKGSVQLPSAPRWLQKICGGLLSRLLVRPYGYTQAPARSGVKDLLLATASLAPGVISSTSPAGCINSLDPRLQPAVAQAVANIFTTTPSFLIKPAEQSVGLVKLDYNSAISAQILELFALKEQRQFNNSTDQNKMSDSLTQFAYLVALTTAHEFCTRYADLGKQLYLSPLIGVLRRLVIRPGDVSTPAVAETSTVPDLTDECELATAAELRKTLDVLRDLLAVPTPSQTVLLEALELSQPLFCLLVQIKADSDADTNPEFSAESSQSTNQTSSLKSMLLGILSRLLSCVTESRSGHLHIIRQWLGLPPTTLSFGTQSTSATDALEVRPLTIYPVHPRLKFRPPQLVRVIDDQEASDRSDYRAVLTREGVSLTDQPEMLAPLVSVIIDMLRFVNPRQAKLNESNGQSVPHFLTVTTCTTDRDMAKHELPTISADLFISLIADLNDNLRPLIQRPSPEVGILPFNEVGDTPVEKSTKTAILSSLLAAAMLDCLGDQIWPDEPEQVVNLLEMTLSRLYMLVSGRIEAEMEEFLLETLSQILGILAFYTQRLKPGETNVTDQFGRLLPILSDLETEIRANSVVASRAQLELLHCLRVMLATRGAVNLTDSKVDYVQLGPTALKSPSPDRIIPEANHNLIEEIPPSDSQTPSVVNGEEPLDPELEEAFEQLKDPLVPVRGHALISLSRLLESRHKCTIGKEERIFQVLFHHLSDEDSYVYLNAIRGLAALGHSLTDRTLSTLLDRFRQLCVPVSGKEPSQQTSQNSRVEFILKLGEAVMRILRDLGCMAPKYRTQVLHCMTVGSKDTEPLVRAASLSNVTELCRLLRHAMGPIVYEVFCLIEVHLTQDHSPSVRQAAANLARAFFLEEQLPDWLAPDVIRDLNRLLSNRSKIERDPCVLEQIEAALGQLDKCTRSSVFLKPLTPESLLKEIRISRPF